MNRRPPFEFDISVTADKKRRSRGRGFSGARGDLEPRVRPARLHTARQVPRAEVPGQPRRIPLVLPRPRARVQSQVELLPVPQRRRPRAAVRRRPGLGPADAAVRRGGAARRHAAARRGPGLAALRLRRPDGASRRQGDAEPRRARTAAARSAGCRRPSGGRSRSSTRRTARPRPRSASSTRRWSRISIRT